MTAITLWVHGWGAWLNDYPTAAAWASRAVNAGPPPALLLPPRARGRASTLTRMLAEVTSQASAHARVSPAETALIFGSGFGEADISLELLERAVRGEVASPVRFQNGVHSAGVSQVAIHAGNRGFCTSLCAGDATFALALFEAHAWLARHDGLALVCVADERTPELVAPERAFLSAAAALCLGASPAPNARPLTLYGPHEVGVEPPASADPSADWSLPHALVCNPSAWALPCIEVLERNQRGLLPLDPRAEWRIRL